MHAYLLTFLRRYSPAKHRSSARLVRQFGDVHVLRDIVSQRLLAKLLRVIPYCSRVGVDLRVLQCIAPSDKGRLISSGYYSDTAKKTKPRG